MVKSPWARPGFRRSKGRLTIGRTLESRAGVERRQTTKTDRLSHVGRPRLSSLLLCAPAHIPNRVETRPPLNAGLTLVVQPRRVALRHWSQFAPDRVNPVSAIIPRKQVPIE